MVMLSHYIPDPLGDADRARAWQLLRLASADYRICLACTYDGPANLTQWRAGYSQVDQLTLLPPSTVLALVRRCVGWLRPSVVNPLPRRRPLVDTLNLWSHNLSFTAALYTHPALINEMPDDIADLRICDLTGKIDDALLRALRRCDYLIAPSTDAKDAFEHFGPSAIVLPPETAADPSPVVGARPFDGPFTFADHAASIDDPPLARAA